MKFLEIIGSPFYKNLINKERIMMLKQIIIHELIVFMLYISHLFTTSMKKSNIFYGQVISIVYC